jgi:hypothetical protein
MEQNSIFTFTISIAFKLKKDKDKSNPNISTYFTLKIDRYIDGCITIMTIALGQIVARNSQ